MHARLIASRRRWVAASARWFHGLAGRRRRALRALEESRRFERGFEQATIAMAVAGPDLRWIRVNASLGELLGYEPPS